MPRFLMIFDALYVGESDAAAPDPYPSKMSILVEEPDGRWRRANGIEIQLMRDVLKAPQARLKLVFDRAHDDVSRMLYEEAYGKRHDTPSCE